MINGPSYEGPNQILPEYLSKYKYKNFPINSLYMHMCSNCKFYIHDNIIFRKLYLVTKEVIRL